MIGVKQKHRMADPLLLNRAGPINLGDTGTLNLKTYSTNGSVLFTIAEHGIERASVIIQRDQVLGVIRELCRLEGIPIEETPRLIGRN